MPTAVIYTVIQQTTNKDYALLWNRFLATIKLIHWYANELHLHQVAEDLYADLGELFDALQEELISLKDQINLPAIPNKESTNTSGDKVDKTILINEIALFINTLQEIKLREVAALLPASGLLNTLDAIFTRLNKALYLCNMIN